MKSKRNKEETFDTIEELRNLTKNNGVLTSGFKKRRARSLFSISSEQFATGVTSGRARLKFLLGQNCQFLSK